MCGFVGFTISAARSSEVRPFEVNRDERLLRSMLALLSHRGPDQEGVHVSSSVALGHRRLSVMAPSGGQQPRVDSRLGCALVYNGEWYDHARLRRSSATTNYRDACDTETLFQALQHDAPERVLPTLRGMFAFAYWDARTHTLTLARDRFGEKPLYYAYVQGELIFASEVKALRLHPALHRVTLDWSALLLYVMMEYIPGADTGFVEIKELPPGHTLTFNVKKKTAPTITAYWSVDNRIAGDGFVREGLVEGNAAPVLETSALETSANYTQQLESQLITTVGAQLEADRALGVFLSGGVDSSLITAVCKRHRDVVQTFTVQFPFRSFDESVYAEQVARALHTQHHTITLSQQTCLEGLETLIEKTDTPFADSSLLPTFLLCQAANQSVTVALGGDGADELFLGYPNFRLQGITRLLSIMPLTLGRLLCATLGHLPSRGDYMNWPFLLRQLSQGLGRPAHAQSLYWMAPMVPTFEHPLINDALGAAHAERNAIFDELAVKMDHLFRRSSACLAGMQRFFIENYLPYDILYKTDRASMYNGLEVRSPFLDLDLFSLIRRSSHFLSPRARIGKLDLKSVLRNYLPAPLVERKKHGFALPVSRMLCHEFRPFLETYLMANDNPMYQVFEKSAVQRVWQQHLSGRCDRGKLLWMLFWLAVFLKRNA